MNDKISVQLADLNVYESDEQSEELCKEALKTTLPTQIESSSSSSSMLAANRSSSLGPSLKIQGVEIPISQCQQAYPKFMPHISFLNSQKSVYNLVFKMVENPSQKVHFVVSIPKEIYLFNYFC